MKYIYILLFAVLVAGCTRVKYVEFTGNIPGVTNGMFVIKDKSGQPIFTESIFDGKFTIKHILQNPGYYDMFITPDLNNDSKKKLYDVYLEGGIYNIKSSADKLDIYPDIKTDSKKQNELSQYYTAASEKMQEAKQKVDIIQTMLYSKSSNIIVYGNEYYRLLDELKAANNHLTNVQAEALEVYVNKHPQNEVEAHLMSEIDYKKDPVSYYRIFQKFTDDEKNSADGKEEKDVLSDLAKLSDGAAAPAIVGKTIDGKPFDKKSIGKKLILVEFWRSDSEVSRAGHKKLIEDFNEQLLPKNSLDVISISLDTKPDVWAKAVKEDKITWAQVNDLKGESSPNMTNWAVNAIPTYDLVDSNWHIVKRDVEFTQIPDVVKDELKKVR